MRTSNYLRQGKRRQNRAQSEQQIDYASSDQVAGKDSLASLLDVSVTMVERWIREGMPVVQRGDHLHDWIFAVKDVNLWRSKLQSDSSDEQ